MEEANACSWKAIHLEDYIYKPEYGFTTSATTDFIGPKFLRITDIQDDKVDWETVPYCECKLDKDRYLLKSGDIVVARIGATTGKTYLVEKPPESIFASYLIRIRTREGLLPEYLNLFFQTETYWKQINQNMGGRLKGGVNIPILQNLILPFPPIPVQRAIAHVLRAVQAAREARLRELALEQERKAALMDHLFTHGTRGEPTKMTAIGEMPESWEIVQFGSLLEDGLKNGIYKSAEYYNKGVARIIELSNLYDSKRILNANTFLRSIDVDQQEIEKYSVKNGDIIINRVSKRQDGVAQVRLLYKPENLSAPIVYESNMFRSSLNNKIVDPEFFSFFSLTEIYQNQAVAKAQKGNQTSINQPALKSILIMLPSLKEQAEISDILSAYDSKISALDQEARLHDELFRAMLEELMAGRLRAGALVEA